MTSSLNQGSSFGRVLLATASLAFTCSALAAQRSKCLTPIPIIKTTATTESVNPDSTGFSANQYLQGQDLIGEGQWVFPEHPWSFFQSSPKHVSAPQSAIQQLKHSAITSPSKPLDGHLFQIIQNLMTRQQDEEETEWYTVDREGFRAAALIRRIDGNDIPVAICIQWKAYDDLWTEVVAQRDLRISSRSAMQIPSQLIIHATRVSETGIPQCHLVGGAANRDEVIELFQMEGWSVDVPPASAGLTDLFWVSRSSDRLEVSLRNGKPGTSATALIRRI